jgi:hypothetical protein
MLLASSNWETATIWTPISVIGTLAVSGFLVVLTWRLLPRQQWLFYSVFQTPMLSGMSELTRTQPKIKVIVDEEEIAAPVVVTVRLIPRGAHDIPAASFDQGEPLVIDFGSRVVATEEGSGSSLGWRRAKSITGSKVQIAPLLIKKGTTLTFTAIVDGEVNVTVPDPPLTDVKIAEREWQWEPVWRRSLGFEFVITPWLLVMVTLFILIIVLDWNAIRWILLSL